MLSSIDESPELFNKSVVSWVIWVEPWGIVCTRWKRARMESLEFSREMMAVRVV